MPDVASCVAGLVTGGCLGGLVGPSLRSRRSNGEAPTPPAAPPVPSPSRWASPPSHLRRATPAVDGKVTAISTTAALTRQMADLSLAPGVARDLDAPAYIELLRKLVGEAKFLQNNPRLSITPEESRAVAHVKAELASFSTQAGGPLIVEELNYVDKRSNLKVTYPGTTSETVAFVGSHLDVVPADPEVWTIDPFSLSIEGDKLFGRGTTDCLGHVALLTRFLYELGRTKPKLKRSIVVLFIAAEEGGEKGIGVDECVKNGKLDEVKGGPVYWVDSADSQPCCGTSGMLGWSLKCSGRLFHSGFPHKAINSIELAYEAVKIVQERFFEDFPPHPSEESYRFATGSHIKPTQIECAKGSTNQICPETTIHGDIRLSPFYEVEDVVERMEQYVSDLNTYIDELPVRGPYSKYVLGPDVQVYDSELRRGKIELKWSGGMDTFKLYAGIAVSLNSSGHKALVQACREAYASVAPFSVSGSLPLVNMMQKAGFDIQLIGFGHMSVYHGVNEYCTLSGMQKAYEVLLRTVCLLETTA